MGRRLWIGNLPYTTTEEQLRALFAEAGTVASCEIARNDYSLQSEGFGYVEMATDEEADAARRKLNGATLGDRQIKVEPARPR